MAPGDPPLICGFCKRGSDVETICGRLHIERLPNKNIAAHHKCMQYSASLEQFKFDSFGGFHIDDVEKELTRGRSLKCHVCRNSKTKLPTSGATAGCAVKTCRKTFHYYCAYTDPSVLVKRYRVDVGRKVVIMYRVYCCEEHKEIDKADIKAGGFAQPDNESDDSSVGSSRSGRGHSDKNMRTNRDKERCRTPVSKHKHRSVSPVSDDNTQDPREIVSYRQREIARQVERLENLQRNSSHQTKSPNKRRCSNGNEVGCRAESLADSSDDTTINTNARPKEKWNSVEDKPALPYKNCPRRFLASHAIEPQSGSLTEDFNTSNNVSEDDSSDGVSETFTEEMNKTTNSSWGRDCAEPGALSGRPVSPRLAAGENEEATLSPSRRNISPGRKIANSSFPRVVLHQARVAAREQDLVEPSQKKRKTDDATDQKWLSPGKVRRSTSREGNNSSPVNHKMGPRGQTKHTEQASNGEPSTETRKPSGKAPTASGGTPAHPAGTSHPRGKRGLAEAGLSCAWAGEAVGASGDHSNRGNDRQLPAADSRDPHELGFHLSNLELQRDQMCKEHIKRLEKYEKEVELLDLQIQYWRAKLPVNQT